MLTTARWISSPCASSSSPSARRADPRRRGGAAPDTTRCWRSRYRRVEALDHRGRRPVAERALEHVDGARALARAPIAERVGLVGPAHDLIEAIAPVAHLGRHRRSARPAPAPPARRRRAARTAPRPARAAGRSRRCSASGIRGGALHSSGGIVERQRVAERLEDDVVDVVVLQVAHLAAQRRPDSGPARVEEVVQQLGAQGRALGRVRRQRLEDESRFGEVVLVGDPPDTACLRGERARRRLRRRRGACARTRTSPGDRRRRATAIPARTDRGIRARAHHRQFSSSSRGWYAFRVWRRRNGGELR